jgi:hypothetical protein
MIDSAALIQAHIRSIPEMTAIFGRRIYSARNLPAGYQPTQGPACLYAIRGGAQDFSSKLFVVSVQFRLYADTEANACSAAGGLYSAINDTQARQICYARMEDGTFPQLLSEPVSNWPYILTYYKFFLQNKEA